MEQQPSARRGSEAVTEGTLHIRYHQQEETLKSTVKLGLFALVLAVAAAVGALQSDGVAQAQVPPAQRRAAWRPVLTPHAVP